MRSIRHLARDCIQTRQQMASSIVTEQRTQTITGSPQQQSSMYSSSINVDNGPALNNVYPSAPPQSSSATNTP
jgi:hypothetical protein